MRIIINVEDELGAKIENAADTLNIKKGEWIKDIIAGYFENTSLENDSYDSKSSSEDWMNTIEVLENEINNLKEEVETQKELKNTYSKLISEKDQRIDDLKESISRIEAISITTTDQIASSKDERINDLTHMIDHLQAQAAAHSAALQSAIKPAALESKNSRSDADDYESEMIEKPKWMFWK
ncbi:DUF3450 domain-containing protein [Methanomicrobium antiquum]|uniref:DUF3450 domain-containing protein n=1 Tax=Methanomicrobium antiquum TaxID=487686 RepID=A0AAF0JLP7_9EURY|nr:hypothetical protein [Methanomicrobium antiquum]MDD3977279.1 hypothetical protein [Methanomicrobium sp.]WFN36327.1 DUF3450 domain-containing protein [Methanomicrobium antiquum]